MSGTNINKNINLLMRTTLLIAIFSIFFIGLNAQSKSLKPVKWSFDVTINDDGVHTLTSTADIKDGWVIYSQHTGEGGPVPMSFSYSENSTTIGKTKEISKSIKQKSKLFETEVVKFKNKAVFTQAFNPNKGEKSISGSVRFMACDNLRCLPPTQVPFDITF